MVCDIIDSVYIINSDIMMRILLISSIKLFFHKHVVPSDISNYFSSSRSLISYHHTYILFIWNKRRAESLHCSQLIVFISDYLQWRHNGRDCVSNRQPHDCLLSRLLKCISKKTSKLRFTGLCAGNSSATGKFPAEMASNAEKCFHVLTSSWFGALANSCVYYCTWGVTEYGLSEK